MTHSDTDDENKKTSKKEIVDLNGANQIENISLNDLLHEVKSKNIDSSQKLDESISYKQKEPHIKENSILELAVPLSRLNH